VNGRVSTVVPTPPRIKSFMNNVAQREPGSTVAMRLLRVDSNERELELKVAEEPSRTVQGASIVLVSLPQLQGQWPEMIGPSMRPGLYVASVAPDSAAATAGLKAGDVIVGLGRIPLPPNAAPISSMSC